MKLLKKILLSFVLVSSLLFLFVSAKDNKLKITVFTFEQRQYPPANNKIYIWMEEKFGVTFEWDILNGDLDQKIGIMIAADDLPDLVQVQDYKFEMAGCLRPLEDLIKKYCPNLTRHYRNCWEQMKSEDGHIYVLPNYGVYDGKSINPYFNSSAFWINKDVLKEFGYPRIQTLDEYFELIKKYMILYPTAKNGKNNVPFNMLVSDWELFNYINPGYYLAGYPNDGYSYVIKHGKKYELKSIYSADFTKKWLEKLNEYYQQGLVQSEMFKYKYRDDFVDLINQGSVLGFFAQGWEFMFNDDYEAGQYVPFPLTFDDSIEPKYLDLTLPNLYRGFAITKNCNENKTIKILKLMDTLLEEENQKVLYWGFEGEDYFLDDNGKPYRTKKQIEKARDINWILQNKAQLWTDNAPKWEGCFSDGNPENLSYLKDEVLMKLSPNEYEVVQKYGVRSYGDLMGEIPSENPFWYPMWQVVSAGTNSDCRLYLSTADDLMLVYFPKLITCNPNDFNKIWKEYTNKLENSGEKKFEACAQEQFNLRLKQYNKNEGN